MKKRKSPRTKKARDASAILDRVIGQDRQLRRQVEVAKLSMRVAQMIYDARMAAGLTQAQLAELVGTTQSVVSRLEDADYEGHSLSMLQRIAGALHRRIEIRFLPEVA